MTDLDDRVSIAPSILSADFSCLGEAIASVEAADADMIHVDVMDGHFVPNMTIGPPVVRALKRIARVPLDVHLMIDNADATVGWYLEAGADCVTVHVEACTHLHRVVGAIREGGAKAGVSLNPATPVSDLEPVLEDVDIVLLMSVNPGFGGQQFIPASLARLEELVSLCADKGVSPLIEIDGGITTSNAGDVVASGARALVAGNAVFGAGDPGAAVGALRAAGESGLTR